MLTAVLVLIAIASCVNARVSSEYQMTELDAYVRKVDSVYGWQNSNYSFGFEDKYTAHIFNLTSLVYLTPNLTSRSTWTHTVIYLIPTNLNASCTKAFIWYTWGHNGRPWEGNTQDDVDIAVISQVAINTGCPAIAVYDIPNQEICFMDDPASTYCDSEDGAIAYTFNRFLYLNKSAEWLLLFPMVKAGIRAMDAAQDIAASVFGHTISTFIVSGASKRGWTTWLVGAVDYKNRISAIVPVVLDALNFGDFIHRQWKSYQGFTFALSPYWHFGLTRATDMATFATWSKEIDPYFYRHRLTMPKFAVNAVGDEFQLLDDQQHWAHAMPGEMKTILIKDADHILLTNFGLVINAVVAYCQSVVHEIPRPTYNWTVDSTTGQITVTTSVPPKSAELVQTTISTTNRDFRDVVYHEDPCVIHVLGGCVRFLFWDSSAATQTSANTFVTNIKAPSTGFTGFYIQLRFASKEGFDDFIFATPASVLPLAYPYVDCKGSGCNGTLV